MAHLFVDITVAAPVFLKSLYSCPSSISECIVVGSSSRRIEPIKLFSILSSDASELSLSKMVCAKTRASINFDHSPGDKTVERGLRDVGRKSSSFAVKIVDVFEGSLAKRLL